MTAVVHQFRRDAKAVQEHAEALMALSTEKSFPHWLAYGTIIRGWALTAQGEGAEGITQMRQGLVAYRAMGAEIHRPYFLGLMAEAYGKVGQLEEGLAVLVEALAVVDKTGERNWEAELHRRKGELLLAVSEENQADAEACFHKAVGIARRQNAKSFELRAVMSLSRLWQQGKQEEAHQLLSEIYGWFTEGFDTADLKEAKVFLEELA
jgi:predicted ATPase